VILPVYFSFCNASDALDFGTFGKSSSGSAKSSKAVKGTKAPKEPTGGSAKSSKAAKGTKAPDAPDATDPPTGSPTALCVGSSFFATFDAFKQNPGDKGIKGSLKGTYLDGNKVDIKLSINFGQRTFNKVKLNEGDLLEWSINTKWGNPDVFGINNKCRPGRAGKHHDRSVACSSLSEFADEGICTKPNGRKVDTANYVCNPKKASDTCERGDLSGKNGLLVVTSTKNGFPKVVFKGVDNFFLKRKDAELAEEINEPYSIVISKNGQNFICAQFILICDNK